ncbi:hypothetical protein M0805_004533 [Coniferiporia weirii]|nr:hypothetical protein M0805_004533 [Coniferiporia weirii]
MGLFRSYIVIFVLTLLASCIFVFLRLVLSRGRTPPGPVGKLIEGSAKQIPKQEPWKTYAKWGQQYGPIVSFRTYLRRFVVLNSAEAVTALLDRRSTLYSDRPISWMYFRLCAREQTVFNIPATAPRHRIYRRMLHTGLSASATKGYWPLLQKETQAMVEGLVEKPMLYEEHIRKNAAAIIMMVGYGYTVTDLEDIFIAHAKETSQITGWAMAPGRWLVDSFPLLRFVPSWFPGAGFKRRAGEWRARFDYLSRVPHAWVKSQIADGKALPSFTSKFLCPEDGSYPSAEEEDIIQWCASGLYAGAADTTVSALLSFVMLMALYPDVQRRAQAEVDEKIGRGNVAEFDRLDNIPYVSAVLKEMLRYAPVGPLALPHKVIQNDEYSGFRISKDTAVIANVWAILHDARSYPSPFTFDPERFLGCSDKLDSEGRRVQPQPDPRRFSFGFGARVCPGSQFAEKWLLLSMCSILASCDIRKAKGVNVTPENVEFTTGFTRYSSSHMKLFDITVESRLI